MLELHVGANACALDVELDGGAKTINVPRPPFTSASSNMIEGVRDFIARHALGKRCTDSACVADNWLRDCTDSACVADKLFKSLAESQSGLWSRGVQNVTAKCERTTSNCRWRFSVGTVSCRLLEVSD